MAVSVTRPAAEKLKVGDRVLIQWVLQKVQGVITEDRGPIGVGGRRLYRIEFHMDEEGEPFAIELPVERIERVAVGGYHHGHC